MNHESAQQLVNEFRTKLEELGLPGVACVLFDKKIYWIRATIGPGAALDLLQDIKKVQIDEMNKK